MTDIKTLEKAARMALKTLEYIDLQDNDRDFLSYKECHDLDEAITALRQALEQPASKPNDCARSHPHENMDAMCELRTEIARLTNENERLKAQRQEPVAQWQKRHLHHWEGKWENTNEHDAKWWRDNAQGWEIRALYTSPQSKPWVGLTEEQIVQLSLEWPAETNDWASHIEFARAIEAKLKEKNS